MIAPQYIVMDNWVKMSFEHVQDKNIGNGEEGSPYGYPFFVYGAGRKQYPRIVITVGPYISMDGEEDPFVVKCTYKKDDESWWQEAPIPLSLTDDVIELIRQHKDGQADVATAPDSRSDERKP